MFSMTLFEPVLEIREPVGAVVEVEVSGDLLNGDPLETVTIGDEGVTLCPDPECRNTRSGFYPVKIP